MALLATLKDMVRRPIALVALALCAFLQGAFVAAAPRILVSRWATTEAYSPPGSVEWLKMQRLLEELGKLSFHTMGAFSIAFLNDPSQGCPVEAGAVSRCYVVRSETGELKGFFILHKAEKWFVLHLSFNTDAEGQDVLKEALGQFPGSGGRVIRTELGWHVGDVAAMRRMLSEAGFREQSLDEDSGRFEARRADPSR